MGFHAKPSMLHLHLHLISQAINIYIYSVNLKRSFFNRSLSRWGWRKSVTGTVSPQTSSFLLKKWSQSWKTLGKWRRKMNWQSVSICLLLVISVISSQRTCQSWRNTLQPILDIQSWGWFSSVIFTKSKEVLKECCLKFLETMQWTSKLSSLTELDAI